MGKDMIYIENHTEPQSAFIPNNGLAVEGELRLALRNTTSRGNALVLAVVGLESKATYYDVTFALPERLADGEYEYELLGGEAVLSKGLAILGEYKRTQKVYDKPIEYTQYGE